MKTYTIKPLEWEGEIRGEYGIVTAYTPFGSYAVLNDGDGLRWEYCFDNYNDRREYDCDSVEAGKQAAEEDWINRITLALVENETAVK